MIFPVRKRNPSYGKISPVRRGNVSTSHSNLMTKYELPSVVFYHNIQELEHAFPAVLRRDRYRSRQGLIGNNCNYFIALHVSQKLKRGRR